MSKARIRAYIKKIVYFQIWKWLKEENEITFFLPENFFDKRSIQCLKQKIRNYIKGITVQFVKHVPSGLEWENNYKTINKAIQHQKLSKRCTQNWHFFILFKRSRQISFSHSGTCYTPLRKKHTSFYFLILKIEIQIEN